MGKSDDFKILFFFFWLDILLFIDGEYIWERVGFEDLGYGFCVIDVLVSFLNKDGK